VHIVGQHPQQQPRLLANRMDTVRHFVMEICRYWTIQISECRSREECCGDECFFQYRSSIGRCQTIPVRTTTITPTTTTTTTTVEPPKCLEDKDSKEMLIIIRLYEGYVPFHRGICSIPHNFRSLKNVNFGVGLYKSHFQILGNNLKWFWH
jgi:hypothetical protein